MCTSTLKVSGQSGSLSSVIARQTGCGSLKVPWTIDLREGQKVNIKLINFLAGEGGGETDHNICNPLGLV